MAQEKTSRSSAPHRVLAIEGSVLRLPITLALLAEIERVLRRRHGRDDLRLRDYFHLVGGEGAGALLAALLARGDSTDEVRRTVERLDPFELAGSAMNVFTGFISKSSPRAATLHRLFGETRLDEIESGLVLLAWRVDTGESLAMRTSSAIPEGAPDWPLHRCVDACLAMPPRNHPVEFPRGEIVAHAALSMAGGAALPMFSVATDPRYGLGWDTGEDRLLLVGVGSGWWTPRASAEEVLNRNTLDWAATIPDLLLHDARRQSRYFLESIARLPMPASAEEEADDSSADSILDEPALTYVNYDLELSEAGLARSGLERFIEAVPKLCSTGSDRDEPALREVGAAAAPHLVRAEHFPAAFDLSDQREKRAFSTGEAAETLRQLEEQWRPDESASKPEQTSFLDKARTFFAAGESAAPAKQEPLRKSFFQRARDFFSGRGDPPKSEQ